MSTKYPVTQAIRALRAADVAFEAHEYAYVEKGGSAASSAALGVPEHAVIKTLVLEDDAREPLVVLMHGDKQVSTRNLARQIGARSVQPCKPEIADRHSGYQVGGTSPFGTKRPMKVYMERTILELPRIWINGGRRGFLVSLDPKEAARVLAPILVDVATEA
jgi:Cys-tRNA(Pro) deacylase